MSQKSFFIVFAGIFDINSAIETLEELMLERGLNVDHTTIYRWERAICS